MIKIALAQINFIVGDLEGNSYKITQTIGKSRKNGVDIVIFPELALVGYPPEDLLHKPHFVEKNLSCLNAIAKECSDIVAMIGFVDTYKGRIYNACALIQDRKVVDVYRKINLPNYGVFDEKRYFSAGDSLSFYEIGAYKFAVSICEDIWCNNFVSALKGKDIDFAVNISASPFHLGKTLQREKALSKAAKETGAFVFYCNLTGGQDELVFDGTSKVYSPKGILAKRAKRFTDDFLTFNLTKNKEYELFKCRKIHETEEAYLALELGLKDYVRKNGFSKVVVGVSGGIDSAVVAALSALALGKSNVYGLIMPSRYTSSDTFNDAKKICGNIGIKYKIIDIEEAFKSFINSLRLAFGGKVRDITEENLQARIRGSILMAFSNNFGYLVLNTGNKSEVSCGYCTLYGDMVGGFGLLKDVPKTLVYKLARHMNKAAGRNIIPLSVMRRAPSAELKPNQKDSDSLPEYGLLDPILKLYVEDDCSIDDIVKKGFKKNMVSRVIKMVDSNEYKRRQGPIGIKITPRSFGKDRRMPITNKFSV
ncbi:MAG: NAD+ synthase [Candidatus Omnitrophota bacterium]